jgi:hypothetical protein
MAKDKTPQLPDALRAFLVYTVPVRAIPAASERPFHFGLPGSLPGTPTEEGSVSRFPTVQITVLKRLYHAELAETYRRPDVPKGPCPFFQEGQEFTVEYLAQRPEGFDCEWA